jgi:hypothetical protein
VVRETAQSEGDWQAEAVLLGQVPQSRGTRHFSCAYDVTHVVGAVRREASDHAWWVSGFVNPSGHVEHVCGCSVWRG